MGGLDSQDVGRTMRDDSGGHVCHCRVGSGGHCSQSSGTQRGWFVVAVVLLAVAQRRLGGVGDRRLGVSFLG